MTRQETRRRWTAVALGAGLVSGSSLVAGAFPTSPGAPGAAGGDSLGGRQFAQGLFGGPGGLGSGFSGPGGLGSGFGGPGGNLAQFPGGRQGGGFPGGGTFGMAPGQTIRLAAVCTDLLSDPPDATTRFIGGGEARVASAGGELLTLARALDLGALALRGRSDSFDPVRRDGSLLLDLYLVNTSSAPLRVEVPAGTTVTPAGQGAQGLPEGADRLFALAKARRLSYTNTMQFAVWAARGSTVEEVEQANMAVLPATEVTKVQGLLEESGIARKFERERGTYAARYEAAAKALKDGEDVEGHAYLATGHRAEVEGVRAADDSGVVTVRPAKGGEFFYRAKFADRGNGRIAVQLFHLVTGRPVRVNRGGLVVSRV